MSNSMWNNFIENKCCGLKSLGGNLYSLIDRSEETDNFDCNSHCVYEKENEPTSRYCFKSGGIEMSECKSQGNWNIIFYLSKLWSKSFLYLQGLESRNSCPLHGKFEGRKQGLLNRPTSTWEKCGNLCYKNQHLSTQRCHGRPMGWEWDPVIGDCSVFCFLFWPDPRPNMSLISGHVTCPGNVYNVVYFETKRKLYLYSAPLTPPTNTHNYSDWSKFDQCRATWHDVDRLAFWAWVILSGLLDLS